MKINSQINSVVADKTYKQHQIENPRNEHKTSEVDFHINLEMDESGATQNRQSQQILTAQERESLHMLFGSEKPETMRFYGSDSAQKAQKGHFIDVMG